MEKEKRNARNKQKMFRSIFAILFRFVLVLSFSFFLFSGSCLNWCHAMQGLQGYAGICRDMQGYSCTRLHNLNRPSEWGKQGTESSMGRQLAAATCQSCNCLGTAAKCLSSSCSRTGRTCLLQTAAILHSAHWWLPVCHLLPSTTCHLPHAACRTASASAATATATVH